MGNGERTEPGFDPAVMAEEVMLELSRAGEEGDVGDDAMLHVDVGEILDRIRRLLMKGNFSHGAAADLLSNITALLGPYFPTEQEIKDPSVLNGRSMLRDPFSVDRFEYWKAVYKFWKANPRNYEDGMRRFLNTFEMPFANLEDNMRKLLGTSDRTIDLFFTDFCPEKQDCMEKFGVSGEVREANSILDLLRIMYEHPVKSDKKRFEAYRKIAIALLIREISENPRLKNRREDSSRFENHLLRDNTCLINPVEQYVEVYAWFRPKDDAPGQCDISFDAVPDGTHPDWERTKLYKFNISGRVSPTSNERSTITVYAFPGNKYEIDAKETPGLSLSERYELSRKPTIVNYKSIEATALKLLRSEEMIMDLARCTILTDNLDEARLLEKMLQVELGSAMSRVKRAKRKSNIATDSAYRGSHQVVENLHNEAHDRNYFFEIRIGTLKDLMIDRSERRISASHASYRRSRSIVPGKILFPQFVYPDMALSIDEAEGSIHKD